jgi:hypothetical protein
LAMAIPPVEGMLPFSVIGLALLMLLLHYLQ